jgi:uncharacterized oligopeptide transporter (OPT) family protein
LLFELNGVLLGMVLAVANICADLLYVLLTPHVLHAAARAK